MDASDGNRAAEQGFTNQLIDGDHERSNRRHANRQRRGRREMAVTAEKMPSSESPTMMGVNARRAI
jgi:hypothetical protein